MIPCQTASIPVNAGADKESEFEPPMYLDGGMSRDRVGNWGSDITGQGQEMEKSQSLCSRAWAGGWGCIVSETDTVLVSKSG